MLHSVRPGPTRCPSRAETAAAQSQAPTRPPWVPRPCGYPEVRGTPSARPATVQDTRNVVLAG